MANRGINKVILIGHLGQDPEVRNLPKGHKVKHQQPQAETNEA